MVLTIDVEPDVRVVDRDNPAPWRGFEQFVERLPPLRERLAELTGEKANLTWLLRMDPQIAETWGSSTWVTEAYRDEISRLSSEGDEMGVHTHPWRWEVERGDWVADFVDAEWAVHCVEMGLDAYETAFGRPCLAHKSGDRYLPREMFEVLCARGVAVDLTFEPGWPAAPPSGDGHHLGLLPDSRDLPLTPYRSSPERFPAEDSENPTGPLLIPQFSPPALRRLHRLPVPADSRHFYSRFAYEVFRSPPPVVAMVLRSDAPLRAWELILRNLEHLARYRGVRFVTASESVERLGGVTAETAVT